MRFDALGLFWEDVPPPPPERKTKVVEKRLPPARTWEDPSYLPGLDEACRFDVKLFDDVSGQDLIDACLAREQLVFDVECYSNYFLVCFRSIVSHKVVYFEMYEGHPLDISKLAWVMRNFCVVGFNSRAYDMPIIQLALAGASCKQLKEATDKIIHDNSSARDVLKGWEILPDAYNHIDLIEVAPLQASLKLYGGRLHCRRMWDLPFRPDIELTRDQMLITRWYCLNDLDQTELLYLDGLYPQIEMRERMGVSIGKDLRSLSDAQIAETVISHELSVLGVYPRRVDVDPGTVYQYQPPPFIKFSTSYMQGIFSQICAFDFEVAADGYVKAPIELETLKISLGQSEYQMGMGGLHSCEKQAIHITDGTFKLIDRDVASYYPAIILNCGLYPQHLGESFLKVYGNIVQKRLAAKRSGTKVEADSLKITINGTFGKLGSKWSFMYAPNLLFQVTLTGQLSLLMLIEQLEEAGFPVVSANTDGIVFKVRVDRQDEADAIVAGWEQHTAFETEVSEYVALYSRDVNNYIAVKADGSTKNKGAFSNPWVHKQSIFRLHKNPVTTICIEAVEQYLINKIPVNVTIAQCTDIRKFIAVRNVEGGAVKDGVYLGKSIRWYYGSNELGEIVYAVNGNKVPKTEGAIPLMTLPETLPVDIDYIRYELESKKILRNFGVLVDI